MVSLSKLLNLLLGAVVVGCAAYISWNFWSERYSAPTKYLSVAVLTRTTEPGGRLIIRTTADRRRICPGKVDRFIVRLNTQADIGDELVYHDVEDITPASLGEAKNVTFHLDLPKDIAPGHYVYRAVAHPICNGIKFDLSVPEASFQRIMLVQISMYF